MFRYICILSIAWSTNAQNDGTNLYTFFTDSKTQTIDQMKCSKIQPVDGGVWQGCYECYTCDHPRFLQHQRAKLFTRRLIVDENCAPLEVCCVHQLEVTSIRSQEKCGESNPEGEPRRVRPTLRSVLPGQYPWRAWIYAGDSKRCPATYIHSSPELLVTTATCMSYTQHEDNLSVRFERDTNKIANIAGITIHPDFDFQQNDIALVRLEESVKGSLPVCVPDSTPEVGTYCVVISRDDITISAVIPPQKQCNNTDGTMCAIVPRHDYVPEVGTGLFCLDQRQKVQKYYLHGVILSNFENIIRYTKVSHYEEWIAQEYSP